MYMLYCIRRYIKLIRESDKLKEPPIKEQIKDNIINKEKNNLYDCYLCQRDGYLIWGTCDICGSYNSH